MALPLIDLTRVRRPQIRPSLNLVQAGGRAARVIIVTFAAAAVGMAMIAVLHTQIASRQYQIDQLDRRIAVANEDFDSLRSIRAELRSPTRLDVEGRRLDMRPATSSRFLPIDPQVLAITIARTGMSPEVSQAPDNLGPLDQFRLVKRVGGMER